MTLFWKEVEINPIDLSNIRIDLFKKYSFEKMSVGDTVNIQAQERGEMIKYIITKKDDADSFLKSFEIKKFIFNRPLFELEVRNEMLKTPEINIPSNEV